MLKMRCAFMWDCREIVMNGTVKERWVWKDSLPLLALTLQTKNNKKKHQTHKNIYLKDQKRRVLPQNKRISNEYHICNHDTIYDLKLNLKVLRKKKYKTIRGRFKDVLILWNVGCCYNFEICEYWNSVYVSKFVAWFASSLRWPIYVS